MFGYNENTQPPPQGGRKFYMVFCKTGSVATLGSHIALWWTASGVSQGALWASPVGYATF